MKKTILVSAIAMAVSGSALASSASDGLYGNIRLGLQSFDELNVVSGKLVFGFKGSEDLGGGMALSYGIEFEQDRADEETIGAISNDKSWVALSGGFGKIAIGEHSDMAGYACGATDILYYGTADACSLGHNTSPANAIQYRGGSGPFSFGVAMTQDSTGDSDTLIGAEFAGDSFSIGLQSYAPEGDDEAMQIGGHYMIGDITLGLTYGDDGSDDDNTGIDLAVSAPVGAGSLAVVVSTMDADNSDSVDLLYSASLGDSGYYGVEINTEDAEDDDAVTLFLGTNF
ncbi:MAG: porin [Gammaproteobacteria bacterium]|nr:porin [Gammaproteobacteria bacterium]